MVEEGKRSSLPDIALEVQEKNVLSSFQRQFSFDSLTSLPIKESLNLSWKNLEYSVNIGFRKEKKKILNGIYGKVIPGRVTAILGPSGSGKTTLLNLLTGYFQKDVKGEIIVNGRPRNLENFRKMSSYIMQTIAMIKQLTLLETMMVAADLNFSTSEKKSYKINLILEILLVLGLSDAKDTRVKNLSGGELKRLSVAVELLHNPSIIFLDEPTSGLDSLSSLQCMHLLRELAKTGRTVVITIHQPNSQMFKLIDDLYVIAEGNCLYNGPATDIVSFLETKGLYCPSYHNPADFVIEICHGEYGAVCHALAETTKAEFVKMNKETSESKFEEVVIPTQRFPTSSWNQFCVLTKRTVLADTRNINFLVVRVLIQILLGGIIGWIFFDFGDDAQFIIKNSIILLFQTIFSIFVGALPILFTVPQEMEVLRRENANSWYSVKVYYLSRMFVELPHQVFFPSIYAILFYWLTGQPMEFWRIGYFTIFTILVSIAAVSYCLIFAVTVGFQIATFVAPVSVLPTALFSSIFIPYDRIPTIFIPMYYISFPAYAAEGIGLVVYGFNRPALKCGQDFCILNNPKLIVEHISDDENHMYTCLVVLPILIVVYQIIAFIALVIKMRRK